MDKRLIVALGVVIIAIIGTLIFLLFTGNKDNKSVVTLYYVNQKTFKLGKQYEVIEGENDLGASLNALFVSEGQGSLDNLFPDGVSYIDSSFDEEEGVLTVNLTSNLLSIDYGPEVNYLVIMSIIYTASDASGYSRIKLIFDGEVHDYLNNTLYLGDYFKIDDSVIE